MSKMKGDIISEIKETLDQLINDSNVPQNIRNNAEALSLLIISDKDSVEARKNKATQLLEEMVSDLNLDMATRTILYQTLSMVESLNNNSIKKKR